jgi:hypothetical protein
VADETTPSEPAKLSPALRRWCREAPPDARRSVVVRIAAGADAAEAAEALRRLGAQSQSVGPGVLVLDMTPSGVRESTYFPWVVAVDEPRKMELRPRSPR